MSEIKRKKIGILFDYGKSWMGGAYYIINLIKSLNFLQDDKKPTILVFYNEETKSLIDLIQYPYLNFFYREMPNQFISYVYSFLLRKNYFEGGLIEKHELDGLFPLNHFPVGLNKKTLKVVAWFPDLQHKFYPQYFNKVNWLFREMRLKLILRYSRSLVLSSNDVFSHIKQFYPNRKVKNIHILKFTSIMDGINFPLLNDVLNKYMINKNYFIISNQFWGHKDHQTVFKAIKLVKSEGIICNVIFTGKMEDNRNPKFINELKILLNNLDINDCTNFIGLVDRGEQLCLMKGSLAVIQPSLFEGWSTVIEDAKALGSQIIASNLDVHLEQLDNGEKGFIFKSGDASELATLMKLFINNEVNLKPTFDNYNKFTLEYAKSFLNIFK